MKKHRRHDWGKWHVEIVQNAHGDYQTVEARACRKCGEEQTR